MESDDSQSPCGMFEAFSVSKTSEASDKLENIENLDLDRAVLFLVSASNLLTLMDRLKHLPA